MNVVGNVVGKAREWFDSHEIVVSGWMERHGYRLLRIAIGIVYIWFGALKPFGLSPAEALVAKATTWIPIPGFLYILAAWEIVIGICFLHRKLVRWGVVLLFLHMPGTMLPLITLRDETWARFPYALSLEGQYIVKNLVLIAAGIVLGGQLTHRLRGSVAPAPDAFHTLLRHGRLRIAGPGELLAREREPMREVYFLRSGSGVVRVGDREVGTLGPDQFVGEMSLFAQDRAAATVEVAAGTHYIAWDRDELRALLARRDGLDRALLETIALDLAGKVRNNNGPGERGRAFARGTNQKPHEVEYREAQSGARLEPHGTHEAPRDESAVTRRATSSTDAVAGPARYCSGACLRSLRCSDWRRMPSRRAASLTLPLQSMSTRWMCSHSARASVGVTHAWSAGSMWGGSWRRISPGWTGLNSTRCAPLRMTAAVMATERYALTITTVQPG